MLTGPTCDCCGVHLEPRERAWTLELPNAAFDVPPERRATEVVRGERSVTLEGSRHFRQVLIPIALSDGFRMTYDAWLEVSPSELAKARAGAPFEGTLASQFPPWANEILGRSARAAPGADGRHLLVGGDALLTRLVTEEWPHPLILASLSDALR